MAALLRPLIVAFVFILDATLADEFPSGNFERAPLIRQDFFAGARPAISNLLVDTERQIGISVAFMALPTNDSVAARFIYDTKSNEPQIQLRRGWEDCDVAHELMHTRMDLLDRFAMLAWRRDVEHTPETEAAFSRIQTYVKDELVHANLAKLGLRVDREIIRPSLFDSVYVNAAQYLDEGRNRANDGMAHLDKLRRGSLCRVCFLMQAELLLKNYRDQLPSDRIEKTEHFIRSFRKHRVEESLKADAVLELFRQHDVGTAEGQRAILVAWIKMEGIEKYVGPSSYQKNSDGHFILPFPE